MTVSEATLDRASSALPIGRRRTLGLFALFMASAMELMDGSIVNVALPKIEESLGAHGAQLQWMVAAYSLAFAVGLITGARLGDVYGRKRLFIIGMIGFTVCSALCGLAQTPEMLIGARALQGLGAAAMIPQVMASIQVMYKPSERAAGMAGFSILAGVATVAGPILGAVLTDANFIGLGWRTIFLINVPVGLISVVAALRLVPESTSAAVHRLDFSGLIMLAAGILSVLYPLTVARELGWPAWTFMLIAAGVVVLLVFVTTQHRKEVTNKEPLVVLSLFKIRSFASGIALLAFFFVPIMGYILVQTLFLQLGQGYTILQAGLTLLPFALTLPVMAGLSATVLVKKLGRGVLQVGVVCVALGLVTLVVAVHQSSGSVTFLQLLVGLFLAGAGFGMIVGPVGIFVLSEVPVKHAGSASGLFNTSLQLASAIGVAVMGTVFFSFLGSAKGNSQQAVYDQAYEPTLLIMAATLVFALVATFFLPRHPKIDDAAVGH